MAVVLALLPATAHAQISWRGEVETAVGVKLATCDDPGSRRCVLLDYRNLNRAALTAEAQLNDRVSARVGLEVRNRNHPDLHRVEDHGDTGKVQPVSLRVPEAWVEGYDVLLPGLDLRVGSQRIPWGTADGWSPADRLNPPDLEDPTHFERRLPVPALLASWHKGDVTLSVAWLPVFVPALLPTDEFDLKETIDDPDDLVDLDDYLVGETPEVGEVDTRTDLPRRTLADSAGAVRLAWEAPFGDLALGAYAGRDPVPQVSGEVIPTGFSGSNEIDLTVHLAYPRVRTLSAELRGPLFGDVSAWGEGVLVFPSRTVAYVTASRLQKLERFKIIEGAPDEDVTGEVQPDEPYVTGVLGADVTLGGDLYLNAQYLRGFFTERAADDLHHYALLALRYPATGGRVRLRLQGGVEVGDDLSELAWLGRARLTLFHADELRIATVVTWQDGADGTTLERLSKLSEARVEVGARF